jgi:hypothetical protein
MACLPKLLKTDHLFLPRLGKKIKYNSFHPYEVRDSPFACYKHRQ